MSEGADRKRARSRRPAPCRRSASRPRRVIGDILGLMGFPARLDVKDAADGGISVALHFDGEVPGRPGGEAVATWWTRSSSS